MRDQVRRLVAMPQMSDENYPEQRDLDGLRDVLLAVEGPLSDDEARALLPLFPLTDDTFYGFAWTLLHLVETASLAIVSELRSRSARGWWEGYLVERADVADEQRMGRR